MKKRLGLYATYETHGILADYIIYCLKEYKKIVDELVVVSNQILSDESRKKIDFVDRIFERSDEGYDVGAFADTLTNLYGWENVQKFDEIVFMNDSIFGPLYPVQPIIQEMSERTDVDFWGLTQRAFSDFDGGEEIYPTHVQLYFYVVKSRMLHSKEFVVYWENIMHYVTDFRSAIVNYEFNFTKYFEEREFQWDVAIKLPGYDTNDPRMNLSPYHYNCYDLVRSGRYPYIKRKLFNGDFVYSKYSDKSDLRRTFDYIREQTNYDENLIWDYVLKNYELGSIIKSLCLYEIIMDEHGESEGHICKEKYKVINLKESDIKVKDIEEKYVLLILLEKKQTDTESIWNAKRIEIIENMMSDDKYIQKVVDLFEKNRRLGVLIPPAYTYGAIAASVSKRWCDKNRAQDLYQKLGLQVPFSKDEAPVHEISAIWCRREILLLMEKEGILRNVDETVFQLISLVAQAEGYYTEIVENVEYLKYHLSGNQELIRNLWGFLEFDESSHMTIEECETQVMQRKVKSALGQKDEAYVYGAGERAFRLVLAIQTFVNIKGIIVSDRAGNPSKLVGYAVECIDDLKAVKKETLIIITVGVKNRNFIETKLRSLGLVNYIFV